MPGSHDEKPVFIPSASAPPPCSPGMSAGTGHFTDDALLVWRGGAWRQVDASTWLRDLARRLPRSLTANQGITPTVPA